MLWRVQVAFKFGSPRPLPWTTLIPISELEMVTMLNKFGIPHVSISPKGYLSYTISSGEDLLTWLGAFVLPYMCLEKALLNDDGSAEDHVSPTILVAMLPQLMVLHALLRSGI